MSERTNSNFWHLFWPGIIIAACLTALFGLGDALLAGGILAGFLIGIFTGSTETIAPGDKSDTLQAG